MESPHGVTIVLPWSYNGVTVGSPWSYHGVTMDLPWGHYEVTMGLPRAVHKQHALKFRGHGWHRGV